MAHLALLQRVASHAQSRPTELAYREAAGGRSLTWRELSDRVDSFAHTLRSALPPRGVVLLCAVNQLEYPIAFLGVLAAGCDVFPVSTEIAEAELLRAAEQSGAIALIGHERACRTIASHVPTWDIAQLSKAQDAAKEPSDDLPLPGGERAGVRGEMSQAESRSPADKLANASATKSRQSIERLPPHPTSPLRGEEQEPAPGGVPAPHPNLLPEGDRTRETPALLLQSSGTTGLPKIVRRSGRSLDAVSSAMAETIGFTSADHVLATVPLTHSYGLEHGLLAPVWAGSTVHLCRGLDVPTVLGELSQEHITIFPAVPAVFEMLAGMSDAPAVTSLRTAYSAGAPLPASVTSRFAERFGVRVTQLYGATEIGSVTFNTPDEPSFDPTSVGKPMRGVSIRILDVTTHAPLPVGEEGHVAIQAESMFEGYLATSVEENPTFLKDSRRGERVIAELIGGYFPTGDLGRLDRTGRLFITGRLKLLIDVGGMKVNPFEVEAVLSAHPQVGDCVVIPVRQSETVSRIKAILTPRDPANPPTTESLRAFAKSRLSAYKVPRVFELRADLPRSSTGKILRQALSEA